MLLGLAAGKIGDLVFYRDGGEQRTRTRVIPKNPRTISQQTQRSKIANASALYRLMAAILGDSFPNRPSNQSGFNAFSALAIPTAPYMTKEQASADCVLPQPVVIAKGTLPSLPASAVTLVDGELAALSVPNTTSTVGTVGVASQVILSLYPSLQQGDTLTFVALAFSADTNVQIEDDVYKATSFAIPFKIDVSSEVSLADARFIFGEGFLLPAEYDSIGSGDLFASAIVVSRVEGDGSLNVANTSLILNEGASEIYESYRSDAARAAAAESYRGSQTSVLRD